jgi:hypothetical protein
MRYTCRGPRVLPDHVYSKVVQDIVNGEYARAKERLKDFGIYVSAEDFDGLLVAADTRVGCGIDLTDWVQSAPDGIVSRKCPCGRMEVRTARGDTFQENPSWWHRLVAKIKSYFM